MIEALKYWIQKTDIDGYRCDVAHMIPTDFWNEARVELDKVKPVFMLAEAEIPEHHDEAFDMSYAWEFYHIMNEIVRGKKTALDVDAYFEKTDSTYPKDAYRMYFTSNHDENSWNGTVKERLGEGAKAFTVLTFTVPGMPLIYSGQEAGLNKRLEFFEKDVIEWKDHDLSDFYSVLINLKKKNKALWNGEHGGNMTRVHTSNDQAIFSFIRKKEDNKVFVVLNLTDKELDIIFYGSLYEGNFTDVFTRESISFTVDFKIKLEPWAYRIFVRQNIFKLFD